MTKPFSQARKELGEDATFEQLEARVKEIKAGSTSTKSKVKLTHLSERGGKSILSIKVDGERAGQISMTRLPNLGKNAVEVSTSQLKPEFRGKGHGTPAYEQAIQYARDKGYSDIYSDDSVSMKAENVWKSLEKKGEAKWDGKLKRYKISAK
jgi:predicted GNAT family acetyltransferase